MKNTITLDRGELLIVITEYLEKYGKKPVRNSYYPWATFNIGKIEIGTQRKPEQIETVVSVVCNVEVQNE